MLETSMHKIGFVKVNYTEFASELRIENKNMNNNLCNMLSPNKYQKRYGLIKKENLCLTSPFH